MGTKLVVGVHTDAEIAKHKVRKLFLLLSSEKIDFAF